MPLAPNAFAPPAPVEPPNVPPDQEMFDEAEAQCGNQAVNLLCSRYRWSQMIDVLPAGTSQDLPVQPELPAKASWPVVEPVSQRILSLFQPVREKEKEIRPRATPGVLFLFHASREVL